jgi:hypothetical protein
MKVKGNNIRSKHSTSVRLLSLILTQEVENNKFQTRDHQWVRIYPVHVTGQWKITLS